MKKRIEPAPRPELRIQEYAFTRARRAWQHVAVLASHDFAPARTAGPSKSSGTPHWCDASTWIRRQRLN